MIKVIKQSHEIWGECPTDFVEAMKWIERAGRICWQSEEKITEDSYLKFTNMLREKEHDAMIEHSLMAISVFAKQQHLDESKFINCRRNGGGWIYAGNYRAFMEASDFTHLEQLRKYDCAKITKNIPDWAKAISVKFITNRAMLAELTRHRNSFAVLSQRFVDHTKANEVILPVHYYGKQEMNPKYDLWLQQMNQIAGTYKALREYGESPQQARNVLSNSAATEIVMTASLPRWKHAFKLRCSPAADPQMQDLMKPVQAEFAEKGWV